MSSICSFVGGGSSVVYKVRWVSCDSYISKDPVRVSTHLGGKSSRIFLQDCRFFTGAVRLVRGQCDLLHLAKSQSWYGFGIDRISHRRAGEVMRGSGVMAETSDANGGFELRTRALIQIVCGSGFGLSSGSPALPPWGFGRELGIGVCAGITGLGGLLDLVDLQRVLFPHPIQIRHDARIHIREPHIFAGIKVRKEVLTAPNDISELPTEHVNEKAPAAASLAAVVSENARGMSAPQTNDGAPPPCSMVRE
ncbi:hypothetical protein FNV43_RR08167 [Rhamnella rubrinervis]|uniref:Uncharacterized protein n=1 Tax=Rhamnella rubrinervis TaxID=2594499 RepID=A0A8K0HG17_9ROSA|nr:hypothetical protein FNV43_RR08167 [Rhamnella rubrinervis]